MTSKGEIRSENTPENSSHDEKIWVSALRAAAEVTRSATASETEVLHAVSEEFDRLELRGGVSLLTEDGVLQVQSRSIDQTLEKALKRLTGYEITGFRFKPDSVDIYHKALARREAVYTDDRASVVAQMIPPLLKPALKRIMKLLGETSVIVAPLVLADNPIGTINVSANWLTPRDLPMVSALADHIAIALGHVRSRTELESTLQLQQLRSQIAEVATSALDLPVVLERIVTLAISELGADAGAVGLIDEEREKIYFPYTTGIPEQYIALTTLHDGNVAGMLEMRHALRINDYQHSSIATEAGLKSGLHAVLGAPLIRDDKPIGLLATFSFTHSFEFTQKHLEMLESIATIATTAVLNAHLYTQAKRRAEESQALIRTARAISSSLDSDTVLQEIAQQANLLLQADGSRIHLIDQDTGTLNCVVAIEPNAEAIMGFPIPLGEGLTGHVVETGEPLLLNDPVPDTRGIQVPGTPEDELECLAIVPLSIRKRTMGAMAVRRLGHDRPFSQNDLELLMGLAAQAAVSIENAHLYGQIESQAQILEQQVMARTRDLAFSESRYRSLVESAQFGIFQLNPHGEIVYVNQALADLVELPMEDLIDTNFVDLSILPQEHLDTLQKRSQGRQQDGPQLREIFELTFRSSSGKNIPTMIGVSVFTDEAGETQGLMGVITDISARIELEQALRAERDRLDTLFNNIGDAVMVTDLAGRILFVNPAWERLHGYSAKEILGKDPGFMRSPEYDLKQHALMMAAVETRQIWQGEFKMQRRDGSSYEAAVTMTPIPGPPDEEISFVTVLHDISALKEVDRLKSQFVSDVSHELRTPLTNIRLYLDLLERVDDTSRVARYLGTLSRESDRLANLIDDLLSLSRMDVGATPLQPRPVDINQILQSLAHDRASLAAQQGLKLEIETDPGIPKITGDERLLGQIFTNLLTNAMNYTDEGGVITLRSRSAEHDGIPGVTIDVEDTGIGITPGEQSDIFKRFYRGMASRSTGAPGTGLGLAICDEITQRHGGTITVVSSGNPGDGSCFSVWLPTVHEKTS